MSNKNKEIVKITNKSKHKNVSTLDELLTNILLNKTIAEIVYSNSISKNVKNYTCTNLILSAVSEADIGLINQIIKRIDGTVPKVGEREGYANIIGNALDDVLQMPVDDRMLINPKDLGIIALAKTIIFISLDNPGKNVSKRKDRMLAADILLSRTGGLRSEPVREQLETKYVRPTWSLEEKKNNS